MKETALWNKLRPLLLSGGKFQKISDRFTPGVPDVLGVRNGVGWAWELKELHGSRVVRTSFRPGQLDWLRDWEEAGGCSRILATHGRVAYAFRWEHGERLEEGVDPLTLSRLALVEHRGSWIALLEKIWGE